MIFKILTKIGTDGQNIKKCLNLKANTILNEKTVASYYITLKGLLLFWLFHNKILTVIWYDYGLEGSVAYIYPELELD